MQGIHEVQIVAEWWDDGSMLLRVQRGARGALSFAPTPSTQAVKGTAVQIAECQIGGRRIAVVNAQFPRLNQLQRKTIARRVRDALGPTVVAIVLDSGESRCDLDESFLDSEEEEEAALAAMASSIVKASWGWDESAVISVQIGPRTLLVEPQFGTGDRHWTARICG